MRSVLVTGRRLRFGIVTFRTMASQQEQPNVVQHWLNKQSEHAFLEEVHGEAAIDWVKKKNDSCLAAIGEPTQSPMYDRVLAILDSKDKIPHVRKIGDRYFNFWQDGANKRGLWRCTSIESYMSESTEWETVLDVDELCEAEGESWVWKGHSLHHPLDPAAAPTRTLLKLSRGGSDAVVLREFDLETRRFVAPDAEERGFVVPEAKSTVSWLTRDALLIGTDMKDGASMTDSGYPRVVRVWRRGTPLADSTVIHEGEVKDVSVSGYSCTHGGVHTCWKHRSLTFYTAAHEMCVLPPPGSASDSELLAAVADPGRWHSLSALPADVQDASPFADQLLITLRSAWETTSCGVATTFGAGAMLAVGMQDFVSRGAGAAFTVLFEPPADGRVSLSDTAVTKNYLILETLDNVKSRLHFWKYAVGAGWSCCGAEAEAVTRGLSVSAVDSDSCDDYWLTVNSFLRPSTLCRGDASREAAGVLEASARPLKALPPQFDASGCEEFQLEAVSKDGTKIPYFVARRRCAEGESVPVPTLLYGYGGFEIPILPNYLAVTGLTWLEKGFCYVTANIRGGGEFGPQWHQAALKQNRHKCVEDFSAVAEDLVARGITTSAQLGIRGGSNGGLLMGNMFVQRPELVGAVVCQVSLLDMRRYHKLLAGASWMAEYGDPDTADWDNFLHRHSPYHNINPDVAAADAPRYPPLFMATSTRDDRVHPYHARCFVKRLEDLQTPALYYYENMEGGHGGAADNKQQAFITVLYNEFLYQQLCKK